ncbi:ABC transporter ATP-binding protein [[Mycoplasma] mobile]|uniref:Unspecified sugar ABC transport ATP-binding protein n=1 Tax=Mycoplasma mobile (strain ATCC 43663 / 163K / NCTC 11711) TaxID=267748 RepID=Q6KIQ3_MYCM1|nr:ABC transporter ATP-binding protein [[Mycoplasma] mobile]AAT27523.1 unspecified sugar ABC transport ATP-binding protein [Mycoplasma mobile 163K]
MSYAIEFVNITKEFGNVVANKDINIEIKKGTVHALVGENGAGKSTLMSILFGLYEPTNGYIKINEKQITITNPNQANDLGIGMVHQHFKLVDDYSNLENIVLGNETIKNGFLDLEISKYKISALQKKFSLNFDLKVKTGNSTVSTQQKVEILKMLYRDADILIFDEPTAILTPQEIEGLLQTILEFKKEGKTIIFISHKLNEIKKIADEITVIRHGKVVKKFKSLEGVQTSDIANAMVGQNIVLPKNDKNTNFGKTILELQNVNAEYQNKSIENISFKLKKGEILALAGVEGNGQEIIEFVISGLAKSSSGKIILNEKDITHFNVNKRIKEKISYIPGDRHKYGLVLDMSVNDNSILRKLGDSKSQKYSIINEKFKDSFTKEIIKKFDVRGAREGNEISRSLSGGNQQKVIVGREFLTEHDFILIVQPTRGLDVGAIDKIHKAILAEKDAGKAILLISYELDEVFALADNISVMHEGKIIGTTSAKNATREEIGLLMTGINKNQNKERSS